MTLIDSGAPEVASLSAKQVQRLLRTLALHRTMLQAGHEDASRIALHQRRPAYILDFELIFKYAFRAIERPDWVSELQFLFDSEDTKFLIGPGTEIELKRFMHAAGVMFGDDGAVEDPGPSSAPDYEIYGLDGETVRVGLFRINGLLRRGNVLQYTDLVQDPDFDEVSLQRAKAALDAARGEVLNNQWDALNWVAIEHMRERIEREGGPVFPYLLTATRALLEASSRGPEVKIAIAREPTDAIYTEILLQKFPDPVRAAKHTLEMAVRASALAKNLRDSPALFNPEEFDEEPEWEAVIRERRVSDELRLQLHELARFVTDPVVAETQRVYDNVRLASASAEQQRGMILRVLEESPRKLFDLIVEVNAALNAGSEQAGLGELWTTVLEMDRREHGHRMTYELFERNSDPEATQYLAAERYLAAGGPDSNGDSKAESHEQYVLRWPTSLDAETVVASFSRAFTKHDVETVDLVVGTRSSVEHFGATLPITLSDVIDAVSEGKESTEGSSGEQLQWVRMGARVFDLYADVGPSELTKQPVVGVFVDSLNSDHLEDLYTRTSARYLLPAWFKQALETIRD